MSGKGRSAVGFSILNTIQKQEKLADARVGPLIIKIVDQFDSLSLDDEFDKYDAKSVKNIYNNLCKLHQLAYCQRFVNAGKFKSGISADVAYERMGKIIKFISDYFNSSLSSGSNDSDDEFGGDDDDPYGQLKIMKSGK